MATQLQEMRERVSEFEEATVNAVAEIDQSDGSRVGLQATLDSVRETLANAYGDTLTDDVNEHLGLEGEVEQDEDDEDDEDE
jgi:hypothetical protein